MDIFRGGFIPILGVAFVDTVDLLGSFLAKFRHLHVGQSENELSNRLERQKPPS